MIIQSFDISLEMQRRVERKHKIMSARLRRGHRMKLGDVRRLLSFPGEEPWIDLVSRHDLLVQRY